ncbi:MAG TPA: MATE family efflux transporter [Anaeromyxobacter sp.]|nr:MATE family efflux transporter [Anaeromyxobacter sp.]
MSPPTLRAELRRLLALALPLSITQAGQALMGVVDVAVLGRVDPVLLGAVGLGNALFFGIGILGMGVMYGVDPLVSQALGAGDGERARRLVWQAGWLALGLSLVLAVPIALAPALLGPLGIPAVAAQHASRFIGWRLLGLPLFFLHFAPRTYLQARGKLRPMLVAVALANAVNLLLDVLLVYGGRNLPAWAGPLRAIPSLGVAGAATATNLSALVQVAVLALAVRGELGARGGRAIPLPDRREILLSLRVGLPAGLHMFAEVSFFALASLLAGRLGTLPLAAHQLALQIASLTFTAAMGLSSAGSVRVGLAVGARDRAGARRAGVAALLGGAAFMSACGLLLLLFPGAVARALTDDPETIATAVPLLRIAAVFQLSDGLQGVGAGILRGAGHTRFTFGTNMVAYWVIGLPLTLVFAFGLGLGVVGLWLGFVVSLALVAASLVWRFLRISSREMAPLAHPAF